MSSFLFLDFDGVVCDSIDECLVSSWLAHHGPNPPDRVPVDFRRRFARLRPFIRSGEDYVLIQDLLARGTDPADQREFDALLETAGPEAMVDYGRRFYEVRERLLATDREYWLSLNRIYPHVARVLPALARNRGVYIMSTKKAPFILEILSFHGIPMEAERVIWSGSERKIDLIGRFLDERGGRALLVDDQIDHFLVTEDNRVQGRLALWGYTLPRLVEAHPEIPRVGEQDWEALVAPWTTPGEAPKAAP